MSLSEGLDLERRLFHCTFGTVSYALVLRIIFINVYMAAVSHSIFSINLQKDQKEGMAAFAEKRKANFTHE